MFNLLLMIGSSCGVRLVRRFFSMTRERLSRPSVLVSVMLRVRVIWLRMVVRVVLGRLVVWRKAL